MVKNGEGEYMYQYHSHNTCENINDWVELKIKVTQEDSKWRLSILRFSVTLRLRRRKKCNKSFQSQSVKTWESKKNKTNKKQKNNHDSLNDPEFGVYKQRSSQYNRPIILQTETTLNGSFAQNRRKRFTSVSE